MSQGGTQTIPVDRERLWATLMELKEIGAYDEATGLRGVRPTDDSSARCWSVCAEDRLTGRLTLCGD